MKPIIAAVTASLLAMPALAQTESYDCVMDPSEIVLVGSPSSGVLESVTVSRGQKVSKDQVLAKLSSAVEIASLEVLEARANSTAAIDAQVARRDLVATRHARSVELREKNVISVDQMNEVAAELAAAESLVRQAELEQSIAKQELERARVVVEQRSIKSPIDGIVVSLNQSPGEFLPNDSHVATIVALDPLYVEAFLPIEVYDRISVGSVGEILPGPPVGGEYEAQVIVVDQVFDAASGTFGVRLELENPDSTLPAGQRCLLQFPGTG